MAAAVALAAWLTGAAPGTATLGWEAPPSCPSAQDVGNRLAARVGVDGEGGSEATRGEALVAREGTGYVAMLVVTTDAGSTTRRLEAERCDTVAEAAVLIVAMVHAERTTAALPEATPAPDEPPAPAPAAAAPAQPRRPTPQPVAARTPAPPRTQAAILAQLSLRLGGLPRVGLGVGGGFAVLRPRWRAELIGRYWAPREAAIGPSPGSARVAVGAGTVGADVGPSWRLGPVELVAMAGVRVGVAVGVGREVPLTRTARRPFVAAGVQLALLWPLHPRVALGVRGTFEAIAVRPRFELRDGGRQYTVAPVAGALAAALEVRLGIRARTIP